MFLNWTNEEIWNFDQYNGLASLEKRWFCDLFKSVFYGEERLVFFIERHQTPFLGQISLKRNDKEISNFSSKPWTNPFEKMQNFRLFLNRCFYDQEQLVFFLESHQTLFLGQIWLQRNEKSIWNVSPKLWTKFFKK